jgi:hypothetical protein
MEDLTSNLHVTRDRTRQVKELCNLILDWAGHTLEENPDNLAKIVMLIKEYKLRTTLENSKNYLEQLKAEEEEINSTYAELEVRKKSSKEVISFYEMMTLTSIRPIVDEYDETLELDLTQLLVDFRMHDKNGTKADQALVDVTPENKTIKFASKTFSLDKLQEREQVQGIVRDKIRENLKDVNGMYVIPKGSSEWGMR